VFISETLGVMVSFTSSLLLPLSFLSVLTSAAPVDSSSDSESYAKAASSAAVSGYRNAAYFVNWLVLSHHVENRSEKG
jgi:hypothetical protein